MPSKSEAQLVSMIRSMLQANFQFDWLREDKFGMDFIHYLLMNKCEDFINELLENGSLNKYTEFNVDHLSEHIKGILTSKNPNNLSCQHKLQQLSAI